MLYFAISVALNFIASLVLNYSDSSLTPL